MTGPQALSLAFIDFKPAAAAHALNTLSADDAAGYLNEVPVKQATALLGRIGSWSASRILSRMNGEHAVKVLRALPFLDAAAILRLMHNEPRALLIGQLPGGLRRDLDASLTFPDTTVGGQMSTDIIALEADHTIAQASAAMRKSTLIDTDVIFVTDADRHYLGSLPLTALFRSPPEAKIDSVIDLDIKPLSARQPLHSVVALASWNYFSNLPVVSRKNHLIGALSIRQLYAGGQTLQVPARRSRQAIGFLDSLVGDYFSSVVSLTQLLTEERPARPASKRPES